jgi:uncharacterized SAM-binding protein YcdF (DUF218 family)
MMLFLLSKTIGWLAAATNFIAVLGVLGLLLACTRFRRFGQRIAAASLILFVLAALSPIGKLLAFPLESRFPSLVNHLDMPDGIIVLGGIVDPELSRAYGIADVGGPVGRLTATADLARRFPRARVVFTGGNSTLFSSAGGEALFVKPLLESFGIVSERVEIEQASRNTWENAAFTKAMVRPQPGQRWVLVTSADQMPRAVGCFRRIGFDVVPYPVGWRTRGWRDSLIPFWGASNNLTLTDSAIHEWIGLGVYWLADKTSELFPGPSP